jgi:hypothetical protein
VKAAAALLLAVTVLAACGNSSRTRESHLVFQRADLAEGPYSVQIVPVGAGAVSMIARGAVCCEVDWNR